MFSLYVRGESGCWTRTAEGSTLQEVEPFLNRCCIRAVIIWSDGAVNEPKIRIVKDNLMGVGGV